MSANANPMPLEPAAPVAKLGPAARVTGVLFNPKATFADIVTAPTWVVPLVLLTLLSVVSVVALNLRMDWRQFAAQQIEKSPRAADLSADQKDKQIEATAKFAPIFSYVFGVPAVAVVVLLSAVRECLLRHRHGHRFACVSRVPRQHRHLFAGDFPEAARHHRY
jgi:hypothetical protein